MDSPLSVLRRLVDAEFYRAIYGDVSLAGIEPAIHYYKWGWLEGRDPAPWFSTKHYTVAYGGSLARGDNPLLYASRSGLKAQPSEYAAAFDRWRALGPEERDDPRRLYLDDVEIVGTELREPYYLAQLKERGLPEPRGFPAAQGGPSP